METIRRSMIAAVLATVALVAPVAATAAGDRDHDRARDLYRHGQIRALADVLAVVRAETTGEVITVELIRLDDRWVYRFQVLAADGRRTTVDADAVSATIIRNGGGG